MALFCSLFNFDENAVISRLKNIISLNYTIVNKKMVYNKHIKKSCECTILRKGVKGIKSPCGSLRVKPSRPILFIN